MPRYAHIATIRFRAGQFPTDMLRYDCCYPAREQDSAVIGASGPVYPGEILTAQVRATSTQKQPPWTAGRWHSFGASVEHLRTEKLS
jgi:hypothetical protein